VLSVRTVQSNSGVYTEAPNFAILYLRKVISSVSWTRFPAVASNLGKVSFVGDVLDAAGAVGRSQNPRVRDKRAAAKERVAFKLENMRLT
jgi:hypothetical protein